MNRFIKVFSFVFYMVSLFLLENIFIEEINAQVVINEISSYDYPGDWVEIYNYSLEPVNLSEYRIRDSTTSQYVDLSGILDPADFYVADLKDYLNKTGDVVQLIHLTDGVEDSEPIETVCYGDKINACERIKVGCYPEDSGQTLGSFPSDGGDTFERFSQASKGSSNTEAVLSSCPTPTPEPTSTNTPTPKPTSTPKPTFTPKPTATSIPTKTPTPTSKPTIEDNVDDKNDSDLLARDKRPQDSESEVLGAEEDKTTSERDTEKKKIPFVAGSLVLAGTGLLGYSAYLFLNSRKKVI